MSKLEKFTDEEIFTEAGRRMGRKGGHPKVLRACPKCGEMKGAREMRDHLKEHRQ